MTAEKVSHTVGPWRIDPRIYRGTDGGKHAYVEVSGPKLFWIAKVQTFDDDKGEYAANARLISQSPIMLEMLKLLQAGYTPDPGTSDLYNEQPIYLRITLGDYRRMGHIISKAEGQK